MIEGWDMELTFSQKKNKNKFTSGTNNTEQQLSADRRLQNSEKIGKSPHNWVGLKKEKDSRWGLYFREGTVKQEKFLFLGKSPH